VRLEAALRPREAALRPASSGLAAGGRFKPSPASGVRRWPALSAANMAAVPSPLKSAAFFARSASVSRLWAAAMAAASPDACAAARARFASLTPLAAPR
jgi:hypothetical protein